MNNLSNSALGHLVNFNNENGLELIGILFENTDITRAQTPIIIHIHGNYGNFYNNKFIWIMSHKYVKVGISFLSFNLSSHDGLCEGYENGNLRYIGGAVADYNESIMDIAAAIKYVKDLGYKRIILQGHSLGCDKAIDYLLNYTNENFELILLSPVDSYAVQEKWLQMHKKETVEAQLVRLKKASCNHVEGLQWIDNDEYGAEGLDKDWIYRIPITRNCLISILEGSAFKYLNLKCGKDFYLPNKTFVFLGINDGLQMSGQESFKQFINTHFSNVEIVDNFLSDHDIKGVESELTEHIIEWIKNYSLYQSIFYNS